MTPPLIAAFYAGLNGLIVLWLLVAVIRQRLRSKVGLGDGGDAALARVIRGHGNAVETIPICIVMLLAADLIGAPALALHGAGASLTVGRVLHGLWFTGERPEIFRRVGMTLTLLAMMILAAGLVVHTLSGVF